MNSGADTQNPISHASATLEPSPTMYLSGRELKAAASMSSVQRVVASRALVRRGVNDTFTARARTLRWGYLSTRMAYRITQDPYSITGSLILAGFTNPKSVAMGPRAACDRAINDIEPPSAPPGPK